MLGMNAKDRRISTTRQRQLKAELNPRTCSRNTFNIEEGPRLLIIGGFSLSHTHSSPSLSLFFS